MQFDGDRDRPRGKDARADPRVQSLPRACRGGYSHRRSCLLSLYGAVHDIRLLSLGLADLGGLQLADRGTPGYFAVGVARDQDW
jgi:hypothetical protein